MQDNNIISTLIKYLERSFFDYGFEDYVLVTFDRSSIIITFPDIDGPVYLSTLATFYQAISEALIGIIGLEYISDLDEYITVCEIQPSIQVKLSINAYTAVYAKTRQQ